MFREVILPCTIKDESLFIGEFREANIDWFSDLISLGSGYGYIYGYNYGGGD